MRALTLSSRANRSRRFESARQHLLSLQPGQRSGDYDTSGTGRDLNSGRGNSFSSSPERPYPVTQGVPVFPVIKRWGRVTDYSPRSNAEIKNQCSYISTRLACLLMRRDSSALLPPSPEGEGFTPVFLNLCETAAR